jgi:hypothetical protein
MRSSRHNRISGSPSTCATSQPRPPYRRPYVPQQFGAISFAAHLAFARRGFDGGKTLRARLDYAEEGGTRQSPPAHPLRVLRALHLREHGNERITRPLGRPPADFEFLRHLVEGEAGAGRGQVTGQTQQAL